MKQKQLFLVKCVVTVGEYMTRAYRTNSTHLVYAVDEQQAQDFIERYYYEKSSEYETSYFLESVIVNSVITYE